MRSAASGGRLGGMAIAHHATRVRLYGRTLILLGLANELRATRAPAWRRERNRLEIDRTIAELARLVPPRGSADR